MGGNRGTKIDCKGMNWTRNTNDIVVFGELRCTQ